MAKKEFCVRCGSVLDKKTGKCPNCDKQLTKKELKAIKRARKKAEKKAEKKEKWKRLSFKEKCKKIGIRLLIIILALMLITGGSTAALVYFKIIDIPVVADILDFFGISKSEKKDNNITKAPNHSSEEKTKELEELNKEIEKALGELDNTPIDADSYFRNNSTVISEIEINDSDNVHTETEAYNNFVERGFTESPVETEYSMDGEYYGSRNVSDTSSTKHPIYQTTYIAENGNIWTISEINGVIMADPSSYNMQSELGVQLIISETESVTSYDSRTNKFYETIPNESELVVKTVGRIDAETLEKLTYGEIDRL